MLESVRQAIAYQPNSNAIASPDSLYDLIMGKPSSTELQENNFSAVRCVNEVVQPCQVFSIISCLEEPPAPGTDVDINAKAILAANLLADGCRSYDENEFVDALTRLNIAVQLEPTNHTALYYRDLTNKKLGRKHAAKQDFHAAKAINSSAVTTDDLGHRVQNRLKLILAVLVGYAQVRNIREWVNRAMRR